MIRKFKIEFKGFITDKSRGTSKGEGAANIFKNFWLRAFISLVRAFPRSDFRNTGMRRYK